MEKQDEGFPPASRSDFGVDRIEAASDKADAIGCA